MARPGGKVYATLPKEGVPDVDPGSIVEICKYVYGLADAPRQWWLCLSSELEKIGMKKVRLRPLRILLVPAGSSGRHSCLSCR